MVVQIAESIGFPADAFDRFYHGIGESASGTKRQDKLKLVKYPDMAELRAEGDIAQGGLSTASCDYAPIF